jgi:hypothetical protein
MMKKEDKTFNWYQMVSLIKDLDLSGSHQAPLIVVSIAEFWRRTSF